MYESETERIRRRQEYLDSEIRSLAKHKPGIIFQTPRMIYFREVEDLIAHILQNNRKYQCYKFPAWRYYCREDGRQGITNPQNRLYYMVEVSTEQFPSSKQFIKLVAGEATDYSGHGGGDMELAEHFIQNWMHLPIEERPLSYLLDDIKSELWKLTGGEERCQEA
jgi:hypothetical protein